MMNIGFASILSEGGEDDPDTDWMPRKWINEATAVILAYNEMQREARKSFEPLSNEESERLRPLIARWVKLYRLHQGARRLSNYICLWMTGAFLDMMKRFPVFAMCNEAAENKIGISRKYAIHNTNHGGNCNDAHISVYQRPKKLYGLGTAFGDYMLGTHALNMGKLYKDDQAFLKKVGVT